MKKRIILIVLMVVSLALVAGTLIYAKNNGDILETIEINEMGSFGESTNAAPSGNQPGGAGEMPNDMPNDLESMDIPEGDASSDVGEIPEGNVPDGEISNSVPDMPSGDAETSGNEEKADGGFAGAGETVTSKVSLDTIYIAFITLWFLTFSLCLIYLIMSKNVKQKVFINKDKVILYILASIFTGGVLSLITVYLANNYYLNSNSVTDVKYSSADDLHIDMSNFSYDSTNNVYYQIGLVYVSDPETVEYESLGIYIPGDYLDCTANSSETYTCEVSTTREVNGFTALTAPIVMPINTAGYSAQEAPTSYSYSGLEDYLEAGFIYVYAGCRGRDNGDDYSGGAPWGVTDLKAAIRYIRYNSDSLPGDESSIFVFGHSGGGAQASILGASGDSELYTDYLESIGAIMEDDDGNYISDAVKGVMAWCPITSLDYANEAYEWNMGQYISTGTRNSSTWTSALSKDLAEAYAEYINELKLLDESGNTLTLTKTDNGIYTSGTYYDYLLSVIESSLSNYLIDNYTSTSDMQSYIDTLNSDEEWVIFNKDDKTVSITSIEAFVNHCKSASKDVGAFDDLNREQAENKVFGNDENNALHFDSIMARLLEENASTYSTYSDYEDYSSEYSSDLEELDKLGNTIEYRVNMYNPMYYLSSYYDGYESSTVSKYWRIRTGITQGDTALTVETNLALALASYGVNVDFETVWNQGHTTAERTGDSTENFINWVMECMES